MNKIGIAVGLWALAIGSALAAPDKNRLDAIWSYADARMDQQMDVWFDDGDFPACIQILRVTTAGRPGDYESWTNLGWMLENVEDWDAAETVYTEYDKDNPNDPDGALPLADYYFRRKQYGPIPALLNPKIGMKTTPHPNVYRILAHAYEKTGKLAESQKVWQTYIALAPNDGAAKANLKRVEKKLNEH